MPDAIVRTLYIRKSRPAGMDEPYFGCKQIPKPFHPRTTPNIWLIEPPASEKDKTKMYQTLSSMDAGIADRNLRIEIFTLCESASELNGRLTVMATFDTVTVTQLPAILQQAAIVLRLRFGSLEKRQHAVRLSMTDPDGRQVITPIEASASLLPTLDDLSSAYNIVMHIRDLCLRTSGEHTIDFYLNDNLEGRLPFTVSPALTPPPELNEG